MNTPNKKLVERCKIISERLTHNKGRKSKEVLLYPYLTECFIGLVEDKDITRAVYDEGRILSLFISEGTSRIDALKLVDAHKNNGGKRSPLFIKSIQQV